MEDSLRTDGGLLYPEKGISRRGFLRGVGALAAGSALVAVGADSLITTLTEPGAPTMTRSTFASHIGETFQVAVEGEGTLALRLAEVRDLPAVSGMEIDGEQSFSVLFYGAVERPLRQGTYEFRQRQMGKFLLFIVPMASDSEFRYYEAVFNRVAI